MNIFLLFLLVNPLLSHQLVKFPGEISFIKSPDGRYEIRNIDSSKDFSYNHILILKNLKIEREDTLVKYGRHVDVLWSPDSKAIAITNYAGSDYSDCLVFRLNNLSNPISIMSEMKANAIKHISGNHHVYIKADKWVARNTLKIKVEGYGDVDPAGFSFSYLYGIEKGLREIKK